MPITKGFRQLVDEANAQITTYSVAQVRERLNDPAVQVVDIRDVRELEREGTVPGCINAPRGMLEFWVDPASPYFKPVFADDEQGVHPVLRRRLAQRAGHQGAEGHGHGQCRAHRRRLRRMGEAGRAGRDLRGASRPAPSRQGLIPRWL